MAEGSIPEPIGLKVINKIRNFGKKPVLTEQQRKMKAVEKFAALQKLKNRDIPSDEDKRNLQAAQETANRLNNAASNQIELQRVRQELDEKRREKVPA